MTTPAQRYGIVAPRHRPKMWWAMAARIIFVLSVLTWAVVLWGACLVLP